MHQEECVCTLRTRDTEVDMDKARMQDEIRVSESHSKVAESRHILLIIIKHVATKF